MISYSQNLEDVVLNRLFQSKPNGFYIDIGAHDPTELSVTKYFYDIGWNGINIEPIPESYNKFKDQRPRDINLNIAIGSKHDFLTVYEVEGYPEMSSLDDKIASKASKKFAAGVRCRSIEVRTLSEICEKYCKEMIDFIKIDVEGREHDVILGGNWEKYRPTMLAIESTVPNSGNITNWEKPDENEAWIEWEYLVLDAGYILVYYDGLNRFYLRKEDEHLKNRFYVPMSVIQDSFSFYKDLRLVEEKTENLNNILEKFSALDGEVKELRYKNNDYVNNINRVVEENSSLYRQIKEQKSTIKELSLRNEEISNKINKLNKKIVDVELDSKNISRENIRLLDENNKFIERIHNIKYMIEEERALKTKRMNIFNTNPIPIFITKPLKSKPIKKNKNDKDDERIRILDKNNSPKKIEQNDADKNKDVSKRNADNIQKHLISNKESDAITKIIERESKLRGFVVVPELEHYIASGKILPKKAWVGIANTPCRIPKWLIEKNTYNKFCDIFNALKENTSGKSNCEMIFTFSEDHTKYIKEQVDIRTKTLCHPLKMEKNKWRKKRFLDNEDKKIIQSGWWMQRMHAVYLLPDSSYKRIWIRGVDDYMLNAFNDERKYLSESMIFFAFMDNHVKTYDYKKPLRFDEYEQLICSNILFAHYYDASAPELLMDCIDRHIPILVNALPAVREYLGDDYPLYYYSYNDAIEKASDNNKIIKANEHMKKISKNEKFNLKCLTIQTCDALKDL